VPIPFPPAGVPFFPFTGLRSSQAPRFSSGIQLSGKIVILDQIVNRNGSPFFPGLDSFRLRGLIGISLRTHLDNPFPLPQTVRDLLPHPLCRFLTFGVATFFFSSSPRPSVYLLSSLVLVATESRLPSESCFPPCPPFFP